MKYNMSGIKSAITSEIDSFITQTFAENDITELSIVGRPRKHLEVVLVICEYEILNSTRRPFEPSNQYLYKWIPDRNVQLFSTNFVSSRKIILQLVQCTEKWFNLLQAPLWQKQIVHSEWRIWISFNKIWKQLRKSKSNFIEKDYWATRIFV